MKHRRLHLLKTEMETRSQTRQLNTWMESSHTVSLIFIIRERERVRRVSLIFIIRERERVRRVSLIFIIRERASKDSEPYFYNKRESK